MSIWTRIQQKIAERRRKKLYARLRLHFPTYCKIHGVSAPDYQGALAQSRVGDKLQIVHVPVDGYPHNVYIYSVTLNRVLGYLQKDLAEKLIQAFGTQFCRDAVIENITGGAPRYEMKGCNICIFDQMSYMLNETDFQALRG